jgi:DNA helicase HerA-like ATPase
VKYTNQIEDLCKKLKPVIGSRADTLWYAYLAEDDKGRKELALNIEIIAEKILKTEALEKQKILLGPPSIRDSRGSFFVGNVFYNDKALHPLYLRNEDFIKQIGIFAVTGEGKTNLAYLLALQLLKKKIPFLVID